MSNLSITAECNRNCSYCFAGDTKDREKNPVRYMQMDTFHKYLDFLERSGLSQLRLLGGEPTLHPNFIEMVTEGIERGFDILIFSNGLISEKKIRYLSSLEPDKMTILLNTINPVENDRPGVQQQQKTMKRLGNRVKLGVNIYERRQPLDYLIEDISNYGLRKEVRLGIAHPLSSRKNKWLHPKDYREAGEGIFEFFSKAAEAGIRVGFDCGFVPCMFPDNSFEKLQSILPSIGKSCNPIPDLLPDGCFIACYPLNDLRKIRINPFITSDQVKNIFEHELIPFSKFGIYPYCYDCKWFGQNCSGGCVAARFGRLGENQIESLRTKERDLTPEQEVVFQTFDITDRKPPAPYFPEEKNEWLKETQIMDIARQQVLFDNISIYIHIPFCREKCAFCDLYSFPLNTFNQHLENTYVNALLQEIKFWGEISSGKHSHVTTVHFGGGSPMMLNPLLFLKILDALNKHFDIDYRTEIAIELTTDELTSNHIRFFKNENISRIHIGLQTLSEPIRQIIGRKDSLTGLHDNIKILKNQGAVVSVDLLFGMPHQTKHQLLSDIESLAMAGMDGFALYEFQPSKFLKRQKEKDNYLLPGKYENFLMMSAGKTLLNSSGYSNVFFNHYGNKQDKNLYFTYNERGEDCIALGAISDGTINRLNFRHKRFNAYLQSILNNGAGLETGFVESEDRRRKKTLEVSLMSTRIRREKMIEFREFYGEDFTRMMNGWGQSGLLSINDGTAELTAAGCYLISNMINQARQLERE